MSLEALVGSVKCASLDEGRAGQFTEHTDTVSRAIPAHLQQLLETLERKPRLLGQLCVHSCWLTAPGNIRLPSFSL